MDVEDRRTTPRPRTCATRWRCRACSPRIDALPVPLIGRIHGAALGGGAGLAAVCDIVVAEEDGAVRIHRGQARHSAGGDLAVRPREDRPIGGARAVSDRCAGFPPRARKEIGLVHAVVPAARARRDGDRSTSRRSSRPRPEAIAAAKALIPRRLGPAARRGDADHRRGDRRAARLAGGTGRTAGVPRETKPGWIASRFTKDAKDTEVQKSKDDRAGLVGRR